MRGLRLLTFASLATFAFVLGLAFVACGGGSGQSGGESEPIPAHEAVLKSLPQLPGSVRDGEDVSTGAGTFAKFWVTGSSAAVQSFYGQQLTALGWQVVDEPTPVASAKGQQTVMTFANGTYALTLYLDDNPSKGGGRGNLHLTFKLEQR